MGIPKYKLIPDDVSNCVQTLKCSTSTKYAKVFFESCHSQVSNLHKLGNCFL